MAAAKHDVLGARRLQHGDGIVAHSSAAPSCTVSGAPSSRATSAAPTTQTT